MLKILKSPKKRKNELIIGYVKSKMLYYEQLYLAALSNDKFVHDYFASMAAYRDILTYLENNL